MTDAEFGRLCNTFGFAPSRALRELIDCVRAQEIEACAKVCESQDPYVYSETTANACAFTIRARKDKQ
jgi:hypothetical protein